MSEPTCEFYGCTNPQLPDLPETGMRFCKEHDDELRELALAEPFLPGPVIRFWIKANGGAKRMLLG